MPVILSDSEIQALEKFAKQQGWKAQEKIKEIIEHVEKYCTNTSTAISLAKSQLQYAASEKPPQETYAHHQKCIHDETLERNIS